VDHRAVLDIGIVANGDRVHIAAHNGIKPNRTIVAHGHFTHNDGVIRLETILPKFWLVASNFLYDCHAGTGDEGYRDMGK
jgi:hypothetical protein